MKTHSIIAYLLLSGLIAGCASGIRGDAPPSEASDIANDAPPSSSYACQTKQIKGAPTAGEGAYGCHFYLHHPETHQILANTAYHLAIYPAPSTSKEHPSPVVKLQGVTDAQGRSGYVRAAFPITPDRVQFVERIGSGPYGLSPRLLRPTDGLAMPGMNYVVKWCGEPYTGMTDERGNGAMFSSTSDSCKVDVSFYRKR